MYFSYGAEGLHVLLTITSYYKDHKKSPVIHLLSPFFESFLITQKYPYWTHRPGKMLSPPSKIWEPDRVAPVTPAPGLPGDDLSLPGDVVFPWGWGGTSGDCSESGI